MVLADKGSTPLFLTISYTGYLTWFFSLYRRKLILGSLPRAQRTLNIVQILVKLGVIRTFYFSLSNRITFFPKYFLGEPLMRNFVSLFKNSESIYVLGSLRTLLFVTHPSAVYLFIHKGRLWLNDTVHFETSRTLLIGCVF